MFRSAFVGAWRYTQCSIVFRRNIFQDSYKCSEAWSKRLDSDILKKVKVDELYYELDQKYNRTGNISAIDVDIFANAINNSEYIDELRDILHKLRQTNETAKTLDSTHYAVVRHFLDFDRTDDLLNMLDDRLNYGIFLDELSANLLLDHFLKKGDFKSAARTASFLMLQEDFLTPLTADVCMIASLKYLLDPIPFFPIEENVVIETNVKKKVEEIKIRVGFIRNPYFDDHFDLKTENDIVGKTIAMLSKNYNSIEGLNAQLIGWILYKKYDKIQHCIKELKLLHDPKVFKETIDLFKSKINSNECEEAHEILKKVLSDLIVYPVSEYTLLESIEEKALSKIKDTEHDLVQKKVKTFLSWEETRKIKLEDQMARLDRERRIEYIDNTQKALESEEERLWFFEKEEDIDLRIEKKKVFYPKRWFGKKKPPKNAAEEYIPPEVQKRRN